MFPIAYREEPSTDTSIGNRVRGVQSQHLPVEISQEHGGNGKPDGTFVAPKCALLFDNLRNATWRVFGAPLYTFDMRAMDIEAVETGVIYDVLRSRLALIDMLQDYEKATKEAKSKGMAEQESQIFASRKVMMKIGKNTNVGEKYVDDFIQSFDSRMKAARRLKCLLDIIGAPEVFLVSFDEEIIDDLGDIPIPEFFALSDEEWASLLSRLRDPKLQLKETCLKLSGVVNMIRKLVGLDSCELRSFLASEIQRRAKEVLGSSNDSEAEDDDYSMPDIE
ncbi:uncharacterized protein N7483_007475 [Penicillium malachiteum]|uniref:uncharacterized protein n=1 Tax=Penicillium malachiteum TaxID=1324776 RepID=UPI002547462C|nr:uncharacterized protein N7483_007475 [Penicillium malachiteum]KAJ5726118.1 hypothetical protein N7483_007475 [Penicillium malachiteum]